MQTLDRDRDTVEYLTYTFDTFTLADGMAVDPPDDYELAAVAYSVRPVSEDWHAAPWLAGPMSPGLYDVYLRFTDSPEIPVRHIARLNVT